MGGRSQAPSGPQGFGGLTLRPLPLLPTDWFPKPHNAVQKINLKWARLAKMKHQADNENTP